MHIPYVLDLNYIIVMFEARFFSHFFEKSISILYLVSVLVRITTLKIQNYTPDFRTRDRAPVPTKDNLAYRREGSHSIDSKNLKPRYMNTAVVEPSINPIKARSVTMELVHLLA
jgi:hypothetical protein